MNKIKLSTENLPLYYNKEYNGFQTLHSVDYNNQTAILGSCCSFLNDSFTTIMRYEVKLSYLSKLQKLNKRNIDKYPFIDLYELMKEYLSYRIKESLDDKTHLFYTNNNVIKSFRID
jgi:hypothetical protein